jgi:hypothetical protein
MLSQPSFLPLRINPQVKSIFFVVQFLIISAASAQILDLEMECPVVYPPEYITTNNIHSISFAQSGGNIKKALKKHANAVITYFFDSTGIASMKVLNEVGYTDTFMMNSLRCQSKNDPDSRFYEPNLFCTDKGMILANQTERSNFFYRYDSLSRLYEWIEIDREQDEQSNVLLTQYRFDSIGHLDSIIEKEGSLRYNLGTRSTDTIYKSTIVRSVQYSGDRMSAVITFTNNNREQTVAASTYRYRYKGEKLDQIELYIGDDKKPIYTLKVLKTTFVEKETE